MALAVGWRRSGCSRSSGSEAADLDFLLVQAEGMTKFVEVGGLDFGGEVELAGFAMMVNRADENEDEVGGRGAVEAEDFASIFRPVFQDPRGGGCSGFDFGRQDFDGREDDFFGPGKGGPRGVFGNSMLFTGEFAGAGIYGPDDKKQCDENENSDEKLACREAWLWIADDLRDEGLEESAARHKERDPFEMEGRTGAG